ncbi:MAG: MFS transporter [Candidatus Saccharibacteria bacterium]
MQTVRAYLGSTFSSLDIRNYRIYTIGQIISQSGNWTQAVAQSWLILQLTNSGTALGVVMAAQFLPSLVFGPWIGVLIDRLPRRRLIIVNQCIGMAVTLIFAILLSLHRITLPLVYVFSFMGGVVMAIDIPARQTFVYELVGEDHLKNAVTLNSLIANLARIIGPALGALLIAGLSLEFCFYANAVSFIGAIVALLSLQKTALFSTTPAVRQRGQIREGFHYATTNPTAKVILLAMLIIGLFVYEFAVTLPLLAKYTFHGSANAYAIFAAAMGLGSILGGLVSAGHKNANLITLGHILMVLGVAMSAVSLTRSFVIVVLLLVVVGACLIVLAAGANTLLMLHTAPEMRGRMNSLWSMIFIGTTPIGGPIIGWLSQHANPQSGFIIGGIAAFVAAVAMSGHGIMRIRRGIPLQTARP